MQVTPLKYDLAVLASYSDTLPASYTLSATLNATDNFNSVTTTVTKPIKVIKGVGDLTFTATKTSYLPSEVSSSVTVGTMKVSDGIGPFIYELVSSTDENYNSTTGADNALFEVSSTPTALGTAIDIKNKAALTDLKAYKIQVKVTDTITSETAYATGGIFVGLTAQPAINFKDAVGGSTITSKTIAYNDSASLIAEGGASDNANAIEYTALPQAEQPSNIDPNTIATIDQGSGAITPVGIGTIKVKAKRPGSTIYSDIEIVMNLTIEKVKQKLSFTNATNPLKIGLGKKTAVDAKATLAANSAMSGVGTITYSSSNSSIASVDAFGEVTGVAIGDATITAKLNDVNGSGYNANYEDVTITKAVKVHKGMSTTWTASTPNIKAEGNAIGNKVGGIVVSDYTGTLAYAKSTASTALNADASYFTITSDGATADVKLAKKISAAEQLSHSGEFKVQIDVTDDNGTQTLDITVQIDEADNIVSFTENGNKITSLTKKFGESGNRFTLTSTSSNSGNTTYKVASSDTSGVLTVNGLGEVTINKSGSATVEVLVGASGGYAQKSVTMNVTVETGEQAIAFKDSTTINRQFVANDTYKEEAELKETSLNTASTRTITYASTSPTICSVEASGTVTMLAKGNCVLKASNSDSNWTSATVTKTINFYDGMGVSFVSTADLQADTVSSNAGKKAGELSVSGGAGTKTYAISTASGAKNKDAALFQVDTSGVVSFKSSIKASDLVGKFNTTKQIYELYVQLETTDTQSTNVVTDVIVEIKGAPLNAKFTTNEEGFISEEFKADKTFTLTLSSNKGNATPSYRLKNDVDMPSDVLQSVDASGLVKIKHANDSEFVGNPLKVEAVIPPNDGYDGETIEAEVKITKGSQPDFAFKKASIQLSHSATNTPAFLGQLAAGTITLTSDNESIVTITGSDIVAKTTDGTATVTAVESGDRDYQSATATTTITVSPTAAYNFKIKVPSVTYGDTGINASIDENDAAGANQVQTWSSSDTAIADIDSTGAITIKKAGTVTITCVQTSTGEPSVTATASLVIDPKPIAVTIDNASKYVGEKMPTFNATIPTSDLVGSDTIGQPTFACKDGDALVNANTAAGTYDINAAYATGSHPNYAITVNKGVLTIEQDVSKADWFHLTGVTSGSKLDPTKWYKEDVSVVLDNAVNNARVYNEISLDQTLWDSTFITISKEGENKEDVYFRVGASSLTNPLAQSTPQPITIKIDKKKPVIKSITGERTNKDEISKMIHNLTFGAFFKPGTKISVIGEDILPTPTTKVSGVKDVTYTVYEIDKGTGIIKPTPIDDGTLIPDANGKSEIRLDDVGLYRVCAIASDNAGNVGIESCSDVNIKKINVDIDGDGEDEFIDSDHDGCPDINIPLKDEDGNIYKINVDRNDDNIPDLNIDSNGNSTGSSPDGIADINVDTDDDGTPDLNVINLKEWKPTHCVMTDIEDEQGNMIEYCTMKGIEPILNIDVTKDSIPDIDIDNKGDMKPHLNISGDGETAHTNLVKLHEWAPGKEYAIDSFTYDSLDEKSKALTDIDTDGDGKPDINLDFGNDGIADLNIDGDGDNLPELNIDGDGDGEANYNVDGDGNGKPADKVIKIVEWQPNVDGKKDGKDFDTMEIKSQNELEDNDVKIENPGGSFLPNYTFKVNEISDSVEASIKEEIKKLAKDQDIIKVYDVSLWKDDVITQPDGFLRVKIPYDTAIKNPKVIMQLANGSFKEVSSVIENGYIVYETDFLGKVSVVGDKEVDPTPDPALKDEGDTTPPSSNSGTSGGNNSSVKGNYTTGFSNGVNTGDATHINIYLSCIGIGSLILMSLRKRKRN